METCNATVPNDVPESVVDALDCHEVRSANQQLKLHCAITTFVSRFGDDGRAELARDVGFLFAEFVGCFRVCHPVLN